MTSSAPKVPVVKGIAILTPTAWNGQESPYRVSTFDASGDLVGIWPLEPPNRDDPFDVRP